MFKRVLLIVLDGVGCGALPDAGSYGDHEANTLAHVAACDGTLSLPTLQRLGLGNIVSMKGVPPADSPEAAWGRMAEKSAGKDSTTGHWEIAGAILKQPFRTFPEAFPPAIIQAFTELAGVEPLGNVIASGTEILVELGEEHLRTGRPIVYTSSDSVFQIAAHESLWPPEKLYELCRGMREVLNDWQVGRVIARPFVGDRAETFKRTERRHDFSMQPPPMILDGLAERDVEVIAVGKILDIFCGRGIRHHYASKDNADGMNKIGEAMQHHRQGLIFANLIDYDMLYGHRCDVEGFARALERFDQWLADFLPQLAADDLLLITADHGCDPTTPGTDHTREYVPLLAWHPSMQPGLSLGERRTFADVAATLGENYSITMDVGDSFLSALTGD